jgi:hypothetical protein
MEGENREVSARYFMHTAFAPTDQGGRGTGQILKQHPSEQRKQHYSQENGLGERAIPGPPFAPAAPGLADRADDS